MTWTRLDDNWMADEAFDSLDIYARWHYLAMIQFCSRGKRYTGVMPRAEAETCSTAPDKVGILDKLIAADLVKTLDGERVQIARIGDHVPSAELLEKLAQDRVRAARYRKHKQGDHTECQPDRCSASRDGSRQSSRDARDGTETGQAVTGQAVTGSTTPTGVDDSDAEDAWRRGVDYHQEAFPDDYGDEVA